jgi:hypothetical protein
MTMLARVRTFACVSLFTAVATSAIAAPNVYSAACAERDLKVVTLIESMGETQLLPDAALGQLGLAHMQARLSCLAGREEDALAIYDVILLVGTPVSPERM